MINFAATTSHDGYPCHYFGTRLSTCGTTLHCVGVFTQWGLFERTYDSEGRRLSWDHGKAKYFVDEQRQESVGPSTTNEGGAIVSNPKWQIGPVKLANGFDAVINRFCEKRQKYIGELQDGSGGWFAREWDANGWYSFRGKTAEDPYNLAPPPKKTVRVQRWMVVYPNGTTCTFSEKDEAINEAKQSGFALLEIDREVEEGEGL